MCMSVWSFTFCYARWLILASSIPISPMLDMLASYACFLEMGERGARLIPPTKPDSPNGKRWTLESDKRAEAFVKSVVLLCWPEKGKKHHQNPLFLPFQPRSGPFPGTGKRQKLIAFVWMNCPWPCSRALGREKWKRKWNPFTRFFISFLFRFRFSEPKRSKCWLTIGAKSKRGEERRMKWVGKKLVHKKTSIHPFAPRLFSLETRMEKNENLNLPQNRANRHNIR